MEHEEKAGEEHEEEADRLEREVDDMEDRSDEVKKEIDETEGDWEARQHDESVPGAVPEAEEPTGAEDSDDEDEDS